MRRYIIFIFLTTLLTVGISCNSQAKDKSNSESSEKNAKTLKVSSYKKFIDKVNTGNKTAIEEGLKLLFKGKLINNIGWLDDTRDYWLERYIEFGPLKSHSFGNDKLNDNEIAWFYGKISKDWVGLDFDFNDSNKITHTNILRSCIPSSVNKKLNNKQADNKQLISGLTSYFKNMESADLFSGSVLVAQGEDIIFADYYGFSDIENNIKNSEKNTFVIASTTKLFTSISIAKLVDEGKINLNNFIINYLPDFPNKIGEKVTVANLLSHSSGIELDDFDGYMSKISKAKNVKETYEIILKYLPNLYKDNNFIKPDGFDYSNENFDLLGKIIQNVSGLDYYDYLRANLFIPFQMDRTKPVYKNNIDNNLAKTYQVSAGGNSHDGTREMVSQVDFAVSRPGGSFQSTALNLYNLLKAFNKGSIVSKTTKKLFSSRKIESLNLPFYKSNYGYGFFVNERYGKSNYGHAGGKPGVSSRCEYYPDKDIYVIVLSNYNGAANVAANYISELIFK